ncbi:Diacylglycerol kinase family enzyme [Halopseudomonas litoralis]|uniref:Diacylglycerol kinase family enzyme n=1 Tax=Halopseudomonas litoralis TaxID=797277 RepID=A0A1H1V030_9GAMM|nr:diacylglycerol kinase family protein [Halopseudomonas litoralis]SDS78148.1 Diacylglycerol kinase family enzyme [Halopseudomonas litoralis]
MNHPHQDLPTHSPVSLTGNEPLFMVMNSGSGKNDSTEIQATIQAACEQAGRNCELIVVEHGDQLQAAAEKAVALARTHGGIVVAVGGDGTLNAVCQTVVGQNVPFGVLPQGTFNYFGRAHNISQNTTQAVHDLLNGRLEYISLGRLNRRYFLVNASLGLYPRLLEDREAYKQRYGRSRLVALWSAVVTLAKAHRQLNIRLDYAGRHQQLRSPTLVVCNNPLQLEQIGIDPQLPEGADHLVALTSRPVGTLALYGLLIQGLMSRMGEADNIISIGFQKMSVHLGRRPRMVKVAMDGEIFRMRTPLEFSIAVKALPLLIPRTAPAPEHP